MRGTNKKRERASEPILELTTQKRALKCRTGGRIENVDGSMIRHAVRSSTEKAGKGGENNANCAPPGDMPPRILVEGGAESGRTVSPFLDQQK